MAGLLDKIKGMFGGSKGAATGGTTAGKGATSMDVIKEKAGAVKDQVDVLVDKAGEKMPPKVKDTFEKVSDKVESVIPGKKDNDAGDVAPGEGAPAVDSPADVAPAVDADDTAPAENPYASDEVVDAAEAAEETPPS